MQKGQMHGRCTGGGGDKCRKVKCAGGGGDKCAGGAQEVVGISAERSSAQELHGKCVGGVREVVGISAERSSAREVRGRCTGGGGDKCRKVKSPPPPAHLPCT